MLICLQCQKSLKPGKVVSFIITENDILKGEKYTTHFSYTGQIYQCPSCQCALIISKTTPKNIISSAPNADYNFQEEEL